jgi:fatty-acyl-CoA synthase
MIRELQEKIEADWLKRWAMYSPRSVAIHCADSGRAFTYRELFERSAALAEKLGAAYGIGKGDRVAVLALNEPETVVLFCALQRLGAILVPLNFRFAAREVEHVVRDSEPKLLIYQEPFAGAVRGLGSQKLLAFEGPLGLAGMVAAEPQAGFRAMAGGFEDPVMILYTSGTTGQPKGAVITNKMLFWNSVNTGLSLSLTRADSAVIFHPLFHTSGWNVLTTPLFHHGGSIVMLRKFEPGRVLDLTERHGTILFGVPTMMDRMARTEVFERVRLSRVRYAFEAAGFSSRGARAGSGWNCSRYSRW